MEKNEYLELEPPEKPSSALTPCALPSLATSPESDDESDLVDSSDSEDENDVPVPVRVASFSFSYLDSFSIQIGCFPCPLSYTHSMELTVC